MEKLPLQDILSYEEKAVIINDVVGALTNYELPESAITPGASPYAYQNATNGYDEDVIVSGGTVSAIEFSRDGSTWYDTGQTAGVFRLNFRDRLRVTYSSVPTMTKIPR